MSPGKNPLEIYTILPKTNCGQCFLPSCLAFSAAVTNGSKKLTDCPFVRQGEQQTVTPRVVTTEPYEIMRAEKIQRLQNKIKAMDLPEHATKLGAKMTGNRLAVPCLGKEFFVDPAGRVASECHTHAGLTTPLLHYITFSSGKKPIGDWVPFRELKDGMAMNALFGQRGEKRLQRLADYHRDLFDDLVAMFSGKIKERMFASDISMILYPLPKLPVLICYWNPEDDLDSKLNIYFDATADRHLSIEWIFELTVGMVMMFEKIAIKHS